MARAKEQEHEEERLVKLRAFLQKPSIFEKPADAPPLELWRESVIKQIREGKTLKTIQLPHDDWALFVDGCKAAK